MKPMNKFLLASFAALALAIGAGPALAKPVQPPGGTPAPKTDKPADPPKKEEPKKDEKPAVPPPQEKKAPEYEYVKMSTSKGDIFAKLDKTAAPISTANFLSYVDKKFYDDTVFHRVVKGFVIQGGGFDKDLKEKVTDAPIKNEWKNGLKNKRGTLSMARLPSADSATSQFFVNLVDNTSSLDVPRPQSDDAAYAVFGEVVTGMSVVDAIAAVRVDTKMGSSSKGARQALDNCPTETVLIKSVTRTTRDEAERAAAGDKK